MLKDPNLISRQVQRFGTAGDKQISFFIEFLYQKKWTLFYYSRVRVIIAPAFDSKTQQCAVSGFIRHFDFNIIN